VEFREYGFAGAQVDRIAKAAGVVRGTFYFHFPSKDDVRIELARRINRRVARRVSEIGPSASSLRELLRRVNDAVTDEHARVGEAGLLAEMLSLYVRRPLDLSLGPEQSVPNFADELSLHLDVLTGRGALRATMPTELVSLVFMTSLFGIFVRLPPGERRRAACDGLIDLLVAGLAGGDLEGPARLP
jgi:AcrR family transcriptional regulator